MPKAYFGRDLVMARCPTDYKKNDLVATPNNSLLMTVPADFQKGDELLASRTDGKIWAARRDGEVFWINTEEDFVVALIMPKTLESFGNFWRGLNREEKA